MERRAIALAPSATLALGIRGPERRAGASISSPVGSPRGALLVGRPDLEGTPWSHLPELGFAEQEATELAALYDGSALLVDAAADRQSVLRALPGRRLLHFAGHAVALGDDPEDARLLLAASGEGDTGELTVADLWRRRLDDLDLVVLSACRGLDGYRAGRGAAVSLASAFLAAGVPAVVAARWEVPDEQSWTMMRRFHQAYAAGASAPEALRAAMVERIEAGGPEAAPGNWGGVGGGGGTEGTGGRSMSGFDIEVVMTGLGVVAVREEEGGRGERWSVFTRSTTTRHQGLLTLAVEDLALVDLGAHGETGKDLTEVIRGVQLGTSSERGACCSGVPLDDLKVMIDARNRESWEIEDEVKDWLPDLGRCLGIKHPKIPGAHGGYPYRTRNRARGWREADRPWPPTPSAVGRGKGLRDLEVLRRQPTKSRPSNSSRTALAG